MAENTPPSDPVIDTAEDTDHTQQIKDTISNNIVMSTAVNLIMMFCRFFLPPFILMYLSIEEYGIWACCFIMIGYIAMLAVGPENVTIRWLATYNASGQTDKINRLLSTNILVMSIFTIGSVTLFALALPTVLQLFQISPQLQETAYKVLLWTVTLHMSCLIFQPFSAALEGIQQIKVQRLIILLGFILEVSLIVLCLYWGWALFGLFVALAVRSIVQTVLTTIVCFYSIPGLSIHPRYICRESLQLMLTFGGMVQLIGVVGTFNRTIEKFVAGLFVGVSGTGLMELGQKLPVVSTNLSAPINSALLPAMSDLDARQDREKIRKLYIKSSRYLNIFTGGIMGLLAAFAYPLVQAWLAPKPELAAIPLILAIFTLPYQIDLLTGPATAYWRHTTRPLAELFFGLGQLALYPLSIATAFYMWGKGIIPISIGVAVAMLLSAGAYLSYTNRRLEISSIEFMRKIMIPGLVPYAFAGGLLWLTQGWLLAPGIARWTLAWRLITVFGVYTLTAPALMYRTFCDEGERLYLKAQLLRCAHQLSPRSLLQQVQKVFSR